MTNSKSMYILLYTLLPFAVSLLAATWVSSKILDIARQKRNADNLDARNPQRISIPVLGGIAVMFGVVVALGVSRLFFDCSSLYTIVLAMFMMLYVSTIDDIKKLSPRVRFLIEIGIALMLMYTCGYSIDNFHGLWGLQAIPLSISIPLTIVTVIALINSINLIDGVDGYSSGFCIMACLIFGAFFAIAGDIPMVMLASVCFGSLLPFFFHNVFGETSKMFIGDRGTLVMGVVMSVFVLNMFKTETISQVYSSLGMGVIPLTLSILSIPVFDTVRVMIYRVIRGKSPFHPDRTRLHYLFIDMGFSHIGTIFSILLLNLMVILVWYASCRLGASIDVQLYVVLITALLCTFCLYGFIRICQRRASILWRVMRKLGELSHVERRGLFLWLRRAMDGK